MADIEQRVLDAIRAKPGSRARDIAAELGVDQRVVNAVLYGRLKARVHQDRSYRWYPAEAPIADRGPREDRLLDTLLARLCRYYLECLGREDLGEVSAFAAERGNPSYVELDALPGLDAYQEQNPFESEPVRRLLAQVRRDRNPKALFLGYPTRLRLIQSRQGWKGFRVEPILLFPLEERHRGDATLTLTDEPPQINLGALRYLTNADASSLMTEAIEVTTELQLDSAGDFSDLYDISVRLRAMREEWDWQEDIDPYRLSVGAPLSKLGQQGIYNRAILVAAERSPYTKGLETELGVLQSADESKYQGTALGSWLSGRTIESPPADQQPLIEVLPLNSEQRQAVRQALVNPLTVITGPPGTGKSQVVTSILVNAAWQGKSVLFASKNNKAVDVVEARVNALGRYPVLLRLGANQYQNRLAEYLMSLLSAVATDDDVSWYQECKAIHDRLRTRLEALEAEIQALIALRNDVDRLEQRVEVVRHEVGDEVFRQMAAIDCDLFGRQVRSLQALIAKATRTGQPFLTRLFWALLRKRRLELLDAVSQEFRDVSERVGLSVPTVRPDISVSDEWSRFSEQLSARLEDVTAVQAYFAGLADLKRARSLEELSKQRQVITSDLTAHSESLWKAWLQLQPSRLTPEQRRVLGDYGALLGMIVAADQRNEQADRDTVRRYYQLFPQIVPLFPCWAVTSLSARGRVPFEPNFFDLLVVDEASQCDIASAIPLLYRARRAVIIGDPEQLRHITSLSGRQDGLLLRKHGLVERSASWTYTRSLFDLATALCRSEDIVQLRDHFRSHPDIIEFSNQAFYGGRLRVATRSERLRRLQNDEPAVRWIDARGRVMRPGTGGAVNEEEARAVVDEIRRLVGQGYTGTMGVISPFRAQANRIRELVSADDALVARLFGLDFLADTVHKYQGDERDLVLFSPVVSSGITPSAIRFLADNRNLFNVAVTRARAALVVVGDRGAIRSCGVEYLAQLVDYVDHLHAGQEPLGLVHTDFGPENPGPSIPEGIWESEWEEYLYWALHRAGIRPIVQYAVDRYRLDLAVIQGSRRLDIEVDGERYHRNWDGELCRRDLIRNERLMELGWDVMRFWVYQIRDDLDWCLARVGEWVSRGTDNSMISR